MLKKKNILGIDFTDESLNKVLEYIIKYLQKSERKFFIVTPNPEIIVMAQENSDYKNILNNAELALPDGVGVVLAGRILSKRLNGRISGIDFMEAFCKEASKQPITVGFLGGRGSVAIDAANCLREKYPDLQVAFAQEEAPMNLSELNCDMLFVAFGSPKQEEWIYKNLNDLPVTGAMGVGGAFDMISGKVSRAPVFIRKFGLEWLFRLIMQPWRIKRQLNLVRFILLVFRERLT